MKTHISIAMLATVLASGAQAGSAVSQPESRSPSFKAPTEKWVFSVEPPAGKARTARQGISTPATQTNNAVYFGSNDSHLYAIDSKTGELVWRYQCDRIVSSRPVVADGTVYFGSMDRHLYAVDGSTGEGLWKFKAAGPLRCTPHVYENLVLFASQFDKLYALDLKTGEQVWEQDCDTPMVTYSTLNDRTLYVQGDTSYSAFELPGGDRKWTIPVRGTSFTPIVAHGDTILAACRDDILHVLNMEDGADLVSSGAATKIQVESPLLVSGNMVFGAYGNTTMRAINLKSADVAWKRSLQAEKLGSVSALANGVLYLCSRDGEVYGLSATTGDVLWRFQVDGNIWWSMAIDNATLYVGTSKGKLYAFDLSNSKAELPQRNDGPQSEAEEIVGVNAKELIGLRGQP